MNNDIYNFSNSGINKLIEQMQQISRPVVDMVNSTAFKTSMQSAIQQCSIYDKMMQEYFISDTFQNVLKPTIQLYAQQINNIRSQIIITDIYNTILAYKDVVSEIDFNNLKINDNGTIEYDGTIFEKEEVEKNTNELIDDINSKHSININNILKKIIISFMCCLAFMCFPQEILQWFMLALDEGFKGYIGAKMVIYIIGIFKNKYPKIADKDNKYFNTHCAMINSEKLKVRKQPDSKEQVIGYLYYSQLVHIIKTKPYWAKIEYKDDKNKISVSGWVSTKGLKKFNTLTSQFEDVEENEIGV